MRDPKPPPVLRSRTLYAGCIAAVICLGLLSRSRLLHGSPFLAKYAGDALWALVVFLLVGWILPALPTTTAAGLAFVYACATEFSQLYHAPWIDTIRRNPLGHLVLGDTFAWADMAAYFAGIGLGALVEVALTSSRSHRQTTHPSG